MPVTITKTKPQNCEFSFWKGVLFMSLNIDWLWDEINYNKKTY